MVPDFTTNIHPRTELLGHYLNTPWSKSVYEPLKDQGRFNKELPAFWKYMALGCNSTISC